MGFLRCPFRLLGNAKALVCGMGDSKIPTLEPKSPIYIIDYQYTSNWSTMI